MPELPEVEITARRMRVWTAGRTIVAAGARPGSPLRGIGPRAICSELERRRIEGVDRHGKQLFVRLSGGSVLLLHLGMTGKVIRVAPGADRSEAGTARLWIDLDDGARVAFIDSRRFGRVRVLSEERAKAHPEVRRLGPDAYDLCLNSGGPGLAEAIGTSRAPIKCALMDQSRLAGIGNIYASEALFRARTSPFDAPARLRPERFEALASALLAVMDRTLALEESEELRYLGEGEIENPFAVYGRGGEPCPACGAKIRRVVQAGRSTFYCGRCQRRVASRDKKPSPRAR